MQIIYLILGTISVIMFIAKTIGGSKYYEILENLDDDEFPLKGLYGIGFSWSEIGAFRLRGKLRENLIGQAKLLYDFNYAEYYASVVWAQVLTFAHIGITLGLLLAGVTASGLMLVIGFAVGGVFSFYFFNRMNDLLKTRAQECTAELPEIVSTMALLINAGMMLRKAWEVISNSKEGVVYDLMKQACIDMENGMSEADAMHKFGRMSNSSEIRKFTSALAQSIERGGAELSDFLGRQSLEMWTLKKQLMLQKGEAAASKLLIPTAMLFIGIIVAVMTGALGMLI